MITQMKKNRKSLTKSLWVQETVHCLQTLQGNGIRAYSNFKAFISFSLPYAQSKSTDIAATIVTSSTPDQIATACASMEWFLRRHLPDQSRLFFSITFPTLICKIFGFDEQKPQNPNGNGWIDILASANDTESSHKLFNLLSPTGVLLSAITAVDRLSIVKYVFPIERLPEWVRLTLQNGWECGVLSDLYPLFKWRLNDGVPFQVQLNILEYYLF
ncbi:hypothetical protein L1887_00810 [Cichorium endivia]|nr:hypothetical protein L1887_00810 [Cichorium endivia]